MPPWQCQQHQQILTIVCLCAFQPHNHLCVFDSRAWYLLEILYCQKHNLCGRIRSMNCFQKHHKNISLKYEGTNRFFIYLHFKQPELYKQKLSFCPSLIYPHMPLSRRPMNCTSVAPCAVKQFFFQLLKHHLLQRCDSSKCACYFNEIPWAR